MTNANTQPNATPSDDLERAAAHVTGVVELTDEDVDRLATRYAWNVLSALRGDGRTVRRATLEGAERA